jgi:hypothetical protein
MKPNATSSPQRFGTAALDVAIGEPSGGALIQINDECRAGFR